MNNFIPKGTGWLRDNPDFRDYTLIHPVVKHVIEKYSARISSDAVPHQVDLREYFLTPRDQRGLNASSAFACIALHEYFAARLSDGRREGSALFAFQMAQRLQGSQANVGVGLRSVLKAIRRFGLPDEDLYPTEEQRLTDEPHGFLFSYCGEDNLAMYVRLDGDLGGATLDRVKLLLRAGFPCVCGFPVPKSLDSSGEITFRPSFDGIRGGQAVTVTGYDDEHLPDHSGALLIRNSWGMQWGDNGYGWLPYTFVRHQLAVDFWTLMKEEWLISDAFSES